MIWSSLWRLKWAMYRSTERRREAGKASGHTRYVPARSERVSRHRAINTLDTRWECLPRSRNASKRVVISRGVKALGPMRATASMTGSMEARGVRARDVAASTTEEGCRGSSVSSVAARRRARWRNNIKKILKKKSNEKFFFCFL